MRKSLLLFVGVAAASFVAAHVRLIYSGNGNELYWLNPGSISVVIHEDGSDDIEGNGHFPALRNAISAWNDVGKNKATLVENTSASQQANDDWQSDSRHLLYFDETNSSGYFPGASGIVAVTPLTFYTSGRIIDADVLFNGKSFLFTTDGTPGRFDVQDVATHELGHLLGLDHSGCAGATMYPYVDPMVILHRSLSLDDIHGLQDMYPSGTFSRIRGTLIRASNSSPVAGAWVGARDAEGRVVGAVLSEPDGDFVIPALVPGTYEVYCTPLDDPVTAANLTPGHSIQTNFEAQVLGTASPGSGQTASMGTFSLGGDVSVELGRVADDYPLRVIRGEGNSLTVRGANLGAGSSLTCSDPTVILSGVSWHGSWVNFTATPQAGAKLGHLDLQVTTAGGDTHILSAGLEVTPPDPVVSLVSPGMGSSDGGTVLTISGSNFRSGCRVVIGDRRYTEGADLVLVDSNTLRLATKATYPGQHDVVVIDASGVEGRDADAYVAMAQPSIASVFPAAGDSSGATTVTITGEDFVPGSFVSIDGVFQANVTVVDLDEIRVVTEPGVVGGPYVLEVESPEGAVASAAFLYSAKPDPNLSDVSPSGGPSAGGEKVTLRGSNFTPQTRVVFGADPKTGQGGVPAASITVIDSDTIVATTPKSTSKRKSVMVRESDTGQASVLGNAYAFAGESSPGCAAVAPATPPTWGRALDGAGWILALGALLLWRSRRSARVVVPYAACPPPNA